MLLTTTDEIRAHLTISHSNSFDRLRSHLESAENRFIIPLIGQNLYDEIAEFYTTGLPVDPTETQEKTAELLLKLQRAVVYLGYFVGFDFLNINVSDMGFTRNESDSVKSLYKYQEDNLRDFFSDTGFDTLDTILVFLENNIAHFNEFKVSSNYTVLKKSFLPTVKVVEDVPFNINNSRLTLLTLKPHIYFIENTEILNLLTADVYNEIKAEMVKDSPAEKVINILTYIRRPLIYLAAALLMEETGAQLHSKGLFFEKTNISYPDNRQTGPSDTENLARMIKRYRKYGQAYLDMLKSYLVKNAADWNDFEITTNPLFRRDNTNKKTFWA